jgi:DNA-binding protein HU-beta
VVSGFTIRGRGTAASRKNTAFEPCIWSDSRLPSGNKIKSEYITFKGISVNKTELIDAIATAADLPKASAGRALDAVVESITDALTKGDQVALVGFGTFSVKHRSARSGRNPQTGATIEIKASNVPSFKAGKALKDSVNP